MNIFLLITISSFALAKALRCENGVQLLQECICNPGYEGNHCESKYEPENLICSYKPLNDICYYNKHYGVVRVDKERWTMSQQGELDFWKVTSTPTRNADQAYYYDNFKFLLNRPLGRIVELGCGPYTKVFIFDTQ